jgi:hypothetical protein
MKTKYLIIIIGVMFFSSIGFAQKRNVKAFYVGYDDDTQVYYFEDIDENFLEFNKVKSKVLKKFDLNTLEFVDEAFLITYIIERIGDEEEDDYYEGATIIKLKLIELVRNEYSEGKDDPTN